jgi:hypothetical protein
MARKTAREIALETQIAEIRGQLTGLTQIQGTSTQVKTISGKQMVGIRNVSSYTVSMPNKIAGEEGDVNVFPARFDYEDPQSTAVVSYQFWTQIRKGKLVARGQIIRDDSVCPDGVVLGPEDNPRDLALGAEKNLVIDPFTWVDSKSDTEMREAIYSMDSEPSLRRLAAAVDHMIWKIGEDSYKGHEDRARLAIRDCPAKFRFLETLVEERLDQLDPASKDRGSERSETLKF